MLRYFLLLIFVSIRSLVFAQEMKYSEVRFHTNASGMKQLARSGLPVEEGFHGKDGSWDIVISLNDLEKARNEGFFPEILHADYAQWIQERNQGKIFEEDTRSISVYAVPVHFEQGSMGGFYTLQEVLNELDSMRALYPGLISVKTTAGNSNSIEGRPICYVKISDHPDQDENEPGILYNSLIHAREPMGMQQMIFYMWYLLENYAGMEEIRYLVDNLEMYFIPVVNPDGFAFNCATEPNGGGAWRKNRRLTGPQRYGIDLNRNFGYQWGYDDEGSSPDPASETYRGANAFSEPETQSIRDFCVEKQFRMVMNFHTYGNLLLYPWAYVPELTADSTTEETYATLLTGKSGYTSGVPGEILYVTNGDAIDWEYGEQTTKPKSICFTTETGNQMDGFWPPPSRIIPLAQENMPANLMFAHLALRFLKTKRQSPYIISEKQGFFKFSFTRYGLDAPADYIISLEPLDTTVITASGPSRMISDPAQFEVFTDSISYTLAENITAGSEIRYIVKTDNGLFTFRDTLTHYFGNPLLLMEDHCNNMNLWNSTQWNVSHAIYYSADGSITDSPTGNYPAYADFSVNTRDQYDPGESPVAVLEFFTRYSLESGYDFVQVKASADNGVSWIPLSGKYTRDGTANEAPGEPVYDGFQNEWVKEEMLLPHFSGNQIKLGFTLKSDSWLNYDGFYFDDLTLSAIDMVTGIRHSGKTRSNAVSGPIPNPSNSHVSICYKISSSGLSTLILINAQGNPLREIPVHGPDGEIDLNVEELSPGLYYYYIRGTFGVTEVKKLLVIP